LVEFTLFGKKETRRFSKRNKYKIEVLLQSTTENPLRNPSEGEFTYPLNATAATILSLLLNWKSKSNNKFMDLDPQFTELLLTLLPLFYISLRSSSTKRD